MDKQIVIRPIEPNDNVALAKVIRDTLTEFGANKPGTVYFDPTTDALYELFRTPGSFYFVAHIEKFSPKKSPASPSEPQSNRGPQYEKLQN